MQSDPIHVQCVYGGTHIQHLENILIPSLRQTTTRPISLYAINYDPHSRLRLKATNVEGVEVIDVQNLSKEVSGFAENHNALFANQPQADHFVIINPDCIPHRGSIERLIARKEATRGKALAAIVEGRQWPYEHPKEYDPLSLETPWASGAFCLIDAAFYKRVGGMDETYFLYLEDVDLSWQAWLNGFCVLYDPAASISHFSGGPFYRRDLVSAEQYMSLRNFLIISRKFFDEQGEEHALNLLMQFPDKLLAQRAMDDYFNNYRAKVSTTYCGRRHPKVKILGLNQFHEWRKT